MYKKCENCGSFYKVPDSISLDYYGRPLQVGDTVEYISGWGCAVVVETPFGLGLERIKDNRRLDHLQNGRNLVETLDIPDIDTLTEKQKEWLQRYLNYA